MHVEFTYFKQSGKYYSEGEADIEAEHFFQVVHKIREMLLAGSRPGLLDGTNCFHTLAKIYTEHGPLPYLFIATEKGE